MKVRRNIYKIFTAFGVASVSLLSACFDVDGLSDTNSINKFVVTEHYSTKGQIDIGDAEIGATCDTIYIPIKYGQDRFPMKFKADVEFSSIIDQVVGIDFNNMEFADVETPLSFTVMAVSGMPRKYVIAPLLLPYEAPEEIAVTTDIILTPPSANAEPMLYKQARIENEVLTMYVVNAQFPITVCPKFELQDGSEFVNFENGKPLFFEDDKPTHPLTLSTADGVKRDISVRVQPIEMGSGAEGGAESLELGLRDLAYYLPEEIEQDGLIFEGQQIDPDEDKITLVLDAEPDKQITFPVTIDLNLAYLGHNVGFMGINGERSHRMVFESFDDTFSFTAFDLVQNVSREWTVGLADYGEMKVSSADITSFSYNYTPSEIRYNASTSKYTTNIILDPSYVKIDPWEGHIYLKMDNYTDAYVFGLINHSASWKLTLDDVNIGVSEGASYEIVDELFYQYNGSWKETRTIRVTPRYGEPRDWIIIIRDCRNHQPSSANEIETTELVSIKPVSVATDKDVAVALLADKRQIEINLSQDEGCYPITVNLDYKTSEFATVSKANGSNPKEFVFDIDAEGAIAPQTITLTAEDGTQSDWTVVVNRPVLSSETNITSFSVTSISNGKFKIDNAIIDEENGEVILPLISTGSCPVTLGYNMTISRNAKLSDGVEAKGTKTFNNLLGWTFDITGREGNVQTWTVKFSDWAPQLQNYDFCGSWDSGVPAPAGSKQAPYWTSANNKYVTGTTKTSTDTGTGVLLESKIATMDKFAAASLYVGWFDASSPLTALSDPVKLTFQGIEFAANRKLLGMDVRLKYSSGAGNDAGSAILELIKINPGATSLTYHGRQASGNLHSENNAKPVITARNIIGKKELSDVNFPVVEGEWTDMKMRFDYGNVDPFDYTHLNIIFSSSYKGDAFTGEKGSMMVVDSIKLIYEGDE